MSDRAPESFVQPTIPRFKGHYDHLSMLMENFLRSKEYWDLVETNIVELEGELTHAQQKKIDDLKLKDLKVKNCLFKPIECFVQPIYLFLISLLLISRRGHINPMINLCKLLSSKKPDILITYVVTEEWHGFMGFDQKPHNIRFATVPNLIPSELVRANDILGFVEAVNTKLEAPVEQLLDRLEQPVS
ncbi:hypothetical protein L3X38_030698 [Prunus dulcis]|uniref:Uncharacterized protein n=1 Tax=Prunus dulcis TaxID=3755 RepID=A0AAD4VC78_PRUDU|nr:hypothetical protein L3X38_030698 [Prunus dulcis]